MNKFDETWQANPFMGFWTCKVCNNFNTTTTDVANRHRINCQAEPEYIFKKGEGWVVKPKIQLSGKMTYRKPTIDDMRLDDICPRCQYHFGGHYDWKCYNGPETPRAHRYGPQEWPRGPEDL